jgi:nucleoid DNA-binding protein
MNKSELIKEISRETKMPASTVGRVLESLFENVERSLLRGEKVVITDFGTWTTSKRKGFTGHNPRTGDPIEIPSRTLPVFRAGKKFKTKLNNSK